MHLCFMNVAKAVFWPIHNHHHRKHRAASPSPVLVKFAETHEHTLIAAPQPISVVTTPSSDKPPVERTPSPDSVLIEMDDPPVASAPSGAAHSATLSPLDGVCSRYWNVFQSMGLVLEGLPRWDQDGVVVAACSFARHVLQSHEIDYDNLTLRMAVAACFSLAYKHGSDHHPPSAIIYPGHTFLTTVYHGLFLDMKGISPIEKHVTLLHEAIEHIEGQIVVRIWNRIFEHATLTAVGRAENLVESIILTGGGLVEMQMPFFSTLRKFAGFLTCLVHVGESCDSDLVRLFHGSDGGTQAEEALLLLFVYSTCVLRPHVAVRAPKCVIAHVNAMEGKSTDVAVRLASLFLACSGRLRFPRTKQFASLEDKDAHFLLRCVVMERAIAALQARHVRHVGT